MKNYLLTDFTTDKWKRINIESLERELDKLNKLSVLFGERDLSDSYNVFLSRASHSIKNITLVDGKVYGDVEFINDEFGRMLGELIDSGFVSFEIRWTGVEYDSEIIIRTITTWDLKLND